MTTLRFVSSILFALLFIAAGANHFRDPEFYEAIMPPYLPWHKALVAISGVAEVVLGIALLIPPLTPYAAWGLILLLIAVFPANIHMALNPQLFPSIAPVLLWLRLPLQVILILWAYWYTRVDAI